MHVNPYLVFDGRCAEAFQFYEGLFGGKDLVLMPHRGSPAEDHVPPEWKDKILHARMTIGQTSLMASDSPPGRYQRPQGITVSIQVSEVDEAERLFAALAEGGTVIMPIAQTFWAKRFGMVTDRFAIPWMINCE